jgi:hypothetical protein
MHKIEPYIAKPETVGVMMSFITFNSQFSILNSQFTAHAGKVQSVGS